MKVTFSFIITVFLRGVLDYTASIHRIIFSISGNKDAASFGNFEPAYYFFLYL